ncbi:hypothetical protein LTR09_011927 [Extremus antarcticus]|uniref:Uncharacterized protein n=1 Tax=Extremus antarcticus TaxID=702011 RepID=A0AAJ0G773_9PEZI|nr:hypothetical protein LTR09_011927 [Extremus antarcticus]
MADTATPVSPVSGSKHPELTLSAASVDVNTEPVELDATPTSPERLRERRGSKADGLMQLSAEERDRRQKLIDERQGDAAVLVDVPQTPGAEEFGKSEDAEGHVSTKPRASERA